MQHIAHYAEQAKLKASQKSTSDSSGSQSGAPGSSTATIQLSDIDRLFRELKKIFGNAWVSNFSGNEQLYLETRETWFKALRRYPRAYLSTGLRKCVESGKAFVSLPEFVAMCKQVDHDKLYPMFKGLPSPLAKEETVNSCMGQIRKILGC